MPRVHGEACQARDWVPVGVGGELPRTGAQKKQLLLVGLVVEVSKLKAILLSHALDRHQSRVLEPRGALV
jgi:hypothetical protein